MRGKTAAHDEGGGHADQSQADQACAVARGADSGGVFSDVADFDVAASGVAQYGGASGNAPEVVLVRHNYARGVPVPWRLKMAAKMILSCLPVPYDMWRRIGLFVHGDIARTDNRGRDLKAGFDAVLGLYRAHAGRVPGTCLELGPGDSVGGAIYAAAAGVKSMQLVDVRDFATTDPAHYRAVYAQAGLPVPDVTTRATVLRDTNATYHTIGLTALQELAPESIDLSFSRAVLEHIYRGSFQSHMDALFRAHRPGGFSCHWVDLHDHLGGGLNHLRFSPSFWESDPVRAAGFYTNRLTMAEMAACAQTAGFAVTVRKIYRWSSLPIARSALHDIFAGKSDDELNVCTFLMTLTKP